MPNYYQLTILKFQKDRSLRNDEIVTYIMYTVWPQHNNGINELLFKELNLIKIQYKTKRVHSLKLDL